MTDLQWWSVIVGTLMPVAVAAVNQRHWSGPVKAFVTVVLCALATTVELFIAGELSGRQYVHQLLVVLGTALASYHALWKGAGIKRFETNTTVSTPPGL